MSETRRLLRREITYESAKEKEENVLHQLGYYHQQARFFAHLDAHRSWIESVVAHHLGLKSRTECRVVETDHWLHGSFNVCIPIILGDCIQNCVLVRLPLPYRIGEAFQPGNSDEKVRCEAGTYAWLQENCPDVPIPRLYGFALSTGESFTRVEHLPFLTRWMYKLRHQILKWLGQSTPTNYIRHQNATLGNPIGTGYLLIEYIEKTQGAMLSNTWTIVQHDSRLRTNLFQDLSRILLKIGRIPIPKIGSFLIDNDGFLKLANRPLSIEIQQMENENIPTGICLNYTYTTVDSYLMDLLTLHDNRFRYQPNAVQNLGDCVYQLSTLTAMRSVFQSFFQRDFCRGPFVFTLTDLHQSNIFVDSDWHITCLMMNTPYWLTNRGVDEIDPTEYNEIRTEFMRNLAMEEESIGPVAFAGNSHPPSLSDVMNQTWTTGTFWYTLALSSPSGLFTIFKDQIRPLFCTDYIEEFNLIMPFFWRRNVGYIVGCKLSDKEQYDKSLRQAFVNDSD
ncbi:hypothetical protein BO94DRAFT_591969 [Aspergillus sclerotioniger CBS 115572]|uniref:Aminoglycoside phosphotransferase domain-containing protein n=1 Tax=Aspergillus sclerotioniger CBS 115572 TaxID=1450535 RepID=A0A317XCG5_9EURO|nr:hypothetical protein BO94DRAFT_591969 [Aspergillus sclerotioniger CBS 115572]PWY96296.1 hypothetical protein BO94DRAFT_591969 [Aspergillus sclerotioniger CBS 115572]